MEYNNLNNNYYYTNNIMNIDNYSNSDLQSLCCFCFDVLINKLNNKSEKIEFPVLFKNKVFPLFVTWRIGQEKFLRGCVGTFLYEILEESLEKYALTSAFNDLRFKPISCQEIPYLHVGVSLLLNFEQISYGLDWEVGKHGIQIKFKDIQNKEYSATFLPEVAEEQGWDQQTTFTYLLEKTGYTGDLRSVIEVQLYRYEALKVYLSYQEYLKMRKR